MIASVSFTPDLANRPFMDLPAAQTLFSFLPQCCDAQNYQIIGKECGLHGVCYDDLRPLGASYWFSIPYRFGWPFESLLVLHYLLTAISIILSVLAMRIQVLRLTGRTRPPGFCLTVLLALASTVCHLVFLLPTLRQALTDAPASLFALIGCWLLWMADRNANTFHYALLLLLAGISLGMSAWMRVFYVIPVLLVSGAWGLLWLWRRDRHIADLCLLGLLPMLLLQYASSWKHTHRIEYLPPNPGLVEWHTTSIPTGYDAILPGYTYAWYAPCRQPYASVRKALQDRDLRSLWCQLAGKLDFYLGSYSAYTYWDPDNGDIIGNLDPQTNLSTNPVESTTLVNLHYAKLPSAMPGQTPAIHFWKANKQQDAEIHLSFNVSEDYKYKLSLKAWSPSGHQYLTLEIRDHETHEPAYGSGALLTDAPQEFHLGKYLPMSGTKDIVISFPYIGPESGIGKQASAAGWPDINQGDFYLSDTRIEAIDVRDMRLWSLWLLCIHVFALSLVAWFLTRYWRRLQRQHVFMIVFWLLGAAEALALAPEQRYAISIMITLWVLFTSSATILAEYLRRSYNQWTSRSSAANT